MLASPPRRPCTSRSPVARYVVGYVLEEQESAERQQEEAGEDDTLDTELRDFPIPAEAVRSLEKEGTINTEQAFERGLGYLIDGMRASLAAKG